MQEHMRKRRGSLILAQPTGIFTLGVHFGCDKTIEKVSSRFYWKNMYDEIREYIGCCAKCQQMNAQFIKWNAKLHPVPVKPQVFPETLSAPLLSQ